MPAQPGPLFGREAELASGVAALQDDGLRLLTLTGPGGTGKTRLAIALGRTLLEKFDERVCFVDLAPLSDPGLVLSVIAQALAVREPTNALWQARVVEELDQAPSLLVLDNFEHLLEAAPLISELLAETSFLKVLATSRERLYLRWENVQAVPPLALAHSEDGTPGGPAVELFIARARAAQPEFRLDAANARLVAALCARLDGLPLAIELAAARVATVPLPDLVTHVESDPGLLRGPRDAPVRHQTLERAIEWSYELLSEAEKRILRRLAVFAGGCTLDAAERVCAADGIDSKHVLPVLERLVDRSLVVAEEGDARPRYRLLETIRMFAIGHLRQTSEEDTVRDRHLDWCQALADAEVEAWSSGVASRNRAEWQRLDMERDNVRAALRWCVDSRQVQRGLRLAGALWLYWYSRGLFSDWRRWLEEFLSQPGADLATTDRARALAAEAHALFSFQSDPAEWPHIVRIAEEAVTLARAADDKSVLVQSLDVLGLTLRRSGRYTEALPVLQEGLAAAATWDSPACAVWKSALLANLVDVSLQTGDRPAAEHWSTMRRDHARAMGGRWSIARAQRQSGVLAVLAGNDVAARAAFAEGLAASRGSDDPHSTVQILCELGILELTRAHDTTAARSALEQCLAGMRNLNSAQEAGDALAAVIVLAGPERPPNAIVRLAGAVDRLSMRGDPSGLRPLLQPLFDTVVDSARQRSDATQAAHEFEMGQQLGLEQALDAGLALLPSAPRQQAGSPAPSSLTTREWEVACLVAQGLTNREAAERLIVGERTIDTYVDRIRNKLSMRSRVQIATWVNERLARNAPR